MPSRRPIFFISLGADLQHVVLSHVDKCKDLSLSQRSDASTGRMWNTTATFAGNQDEENFTYKLLEELLPGYGDRIVAGHGYGEKYLLENPMAAKPGLTYLLDYI